MFFFFSSRRRHTRLQGDWSSDVCSSDLPRYNEIASKRCAGGETQLWTCCALPAGGARRLCSTAPAPEVQTPDYLAALGTLEAVVGLAQTFPPSWPKLARALEDL